MDLQIHELSEVVTVIEYRLKTEVCQLKKLYEKRRKMNTHKRELRGLSPQANYTDRATAACRRS
jgi:hypothetical protein